MNKKAMKAVRLSRRAKMPAAIAVLDMIKHDPYNQVIKWALSETFWYIPLNGSMQKALLERIKYEDLPLFIAFHWATDTFYGIPTIKELYLKRLKGD